jgi:hypothetical protein
VNMATGFNGRYPRAAIIIRVLVTAWLLAATGILLADGYRIWAVVTAVGAVANATLAYRVYRTTSR